MVLSFQLFTIIPDYSETYFDIPTIFTILCIEVYRSLYLEYTIGGEIQCLI